MPSRLLPPNNTVQSQLDAALRLSNSGGCVQCRAHRLTQALTWLAPLAEWLGPSLDDFRCWFWKAKAKPPSEHVMRGIAYIGDESPPGANGGWGISGKVSLEWAYITHKNLVRKIIEAMRIAHAKSGIQSKHRPQTTHEAKRSRKAGVCDEHFISLNRLMDSVVKVLLECVNRFSISFRWYAFPNFCTQIFRPLAYGVRIPLKVGATIASRTFRLPPVPMSSQTRQCVIHYPPRAICAACHEESWSAGSRACQRLQTTWEGWVAWVQDQDSVWRADSAEVWVNVQCSVTTLK